MRMEERGGLAMTDKPVRTYVVSVFEKPHWRTVLTTKDKAKAFDLAKEIGDKVRIEEITPKEAKTEDGRRLLGGGPGWGKGAGQAEQVRHPKNLADGPLAPMVLSRKQSRALVPPQFLD
ncbi:hypothetical protein B5V02_00945 [Mesorhizobium kowhaii]|uniref:Uncharacterized protein n=2 Tax=Mesorhizobium kowhaii TaxID=1300272 RepID=A0A2W7EB04_9HYPH|nr:hypothetical protein B5V02_00945 [Mesorhizobium kowhaii]